MEQAGQSHLTRINPAGSKRIKILIESGALLMLALFAMYIIRLPVIMDPRSEHVNMVVFMVDDLDESSFDQLLSADLLPNIEEHIISRGVRFRDSVVTNSACCPSRASFLTGQYAHNHGVNSIGGTSGGMQGFHPDGDIDRPSIATWLSAMEPETMGTSYMTGIIGKYFNHYRPDEDGAYPIPAGWDFWRVINATAAHQLEPGEYEIVDNTGTATAPMVYQTRQIGEYAKQFFGGERSDTGPVWTEAGKDAFFLYLTPTAPHVIGLPEDTTHYASCSRTHPQWLERVVPDSADTFGYSPQDYRLPGFPACDGQYPAGCLRTDGADGVIPLAGFEIPGISRLGSEQAFLDTYDQGDIREANEALRPAWIDFQWDPLRCSDNFDLLQRQHLDRLESMLSIDVLVGEVIQELESQGVLDETLIIFTSDNGFMLGEHRLGNKQVAYEEAIRVPLVVRPPGSKITEGRISDELVANIDLAPTILDYAGRSWETFAVDGRSLRPLLEERATTWRDRLLIEHWHPDGLEDVLTAPDQWWRVPTHMTLRTAASAETGPGLTLIEYDDADWGNKDPLWIDFYGSPGYKSSFLYDLQANPSQTENLIAEDSYANIAAALSEALHNLQTCEGDSCRQADLE